MKILIISHEYPPVGGGGANACKELSREFVNAGNTVQVLTVRFGSDAESELLRGGKLKITRVKALRRYRDHCSAVEMLDYLIKADRAAKDILKKETFDLCLCFFGIPGGLLARRLKRKYGLKYVIRMGGGDIPGFQNRFGMLYRIVGPELRGIWKAASALVANSEGLRELARKFCDRYPISVITNGVDVETYAPEEKEDENDGPVRLLTVCRLIERKGLQDVIPAIKTIEKRTSKKIHWTIAGDGPYRDELERMSREAGTEKNIDFIGHIEKKELPDIYRAADVFVFPSYKEGMPNSVLEAMASGLPIVMRRDCQGTAELVRDNGVTVSDDLEDALTSLISAGRGVWKEMGASSRKIVLEDYTWKTVSERYLDLFEQIKTNGQ